MKQIITLSVAAIFGFIISASAQINKGSILLGGSLSGSGYNVKKTDTSTYKANSFTISPSMGFAVSTNTIIGFSLSYSNNTSKVYGNFGNEKSHTYGGGIFLRKYNLLAKNFYIFGEGNLMYDYTSYNYSISAGQYNGTYNSKGNSVNLNVTPGVAYSITRSIQIEAGLQNLLYINFEANKEMPKDPANGSEYKISSFNIGSSLNPISFNGVSVGIRFLFNK